MRKFFISLVVFFFLAPSMAQAEVDGAWLTESKPDWWFVLMDGTNPNSLEHSIGMAFLPPGTGLWEMYFGPKTGPDAANLKPWLSNSNMQATWSSTRTTGTLTVQSCTEGDCPFNTGEVVTFIKVFGDGIGTDEPSDACLQNFCAVSPGLAAACQDFLDTCLLTQGDVEGCTGVALLICSAEEEFGPN